MAAIDLVFEGGGAKGMVFVGALQELFADGERTQGRLLGTSAGAITAVFLAAGYTPAEMLASLAERDAEGNSVFASFLGLPGSFDREAVRVSAFRRLLRDLNLPLIPDFAEDRLDDWIANQLATHREGRHLFSFIERGGWYSADAFVAWMERKLNEGERDGQARRFGGMTLAEFFEATGVEMTLVAADTTAARMLLLNHRTAPHCPVVWAARMSMSVPLLWQEVEWREEWGPYHTWMPEGECLAAEQITGHVIVDGGLLSNFPIALFLADRQDVAAVVGPATGSDVMGLLIDEALPVPGRPERSGNGPGVAFGRLHTVTRFQRLINTVTTAHDNMAIAVFARHIVRLPAGGYATTQFDMTDAEREALLEAGRAAMRAFLSRRLPGGATRAPAAGLDLSASPAATSVANQAAQTILQR